MVHFLEDKYQQKRMLGSASLPYFEVQLPQQRLRELDKGRQMWLATSSETLYISLLGNNDRLQPIPNNQLLEIVIKPRFGSGGEGVMILRKIFEQETAEEDSNTELVDTDYTIEAKLVQGECPVKPSEWLTWNPEFE
jgi:hypothetical protein